MPTLLQNILIYARLVRPRAQRRGVRARVRSLPSRALAQRRDRHLLHRLRQDAARLARQAGRAVEGRRAAARRLREVRRRRGRHVDRRRANRSKIPQRSPKRARKGLFHAQPLSTRSLVVAAGPVTNFIFSILAFAAIALIMGRDVTDIERDARAHRGCRAGSAAAQRGPAARRRHRAADGAAIANFTELQRDRRIRRRPLALHVERDGADH